MIKIIYYQKHHRVSVEGHAESGEFGKDLVCAACSEIVHTLTENLRRLKELGMVMWADSTVKPGEAEIRCTPTARGRATTRLVMDSLCVGFEILGNKYPEYVSYEIHG